MTATAQEFLQFAERLGLRASVEIELGLDGEAPFSQFRDQRAIVSLGTALLVFRVKGPVEVGSAFNELRQQPAAIIGRVVSGRRSATVGPTDSRWRVKRLDAGHRLGQELSLVPSLAGGDLRGIELLGGAKGSRHEPPAFLRDSGRVGIPGQPFASYLEYTKGMGNTVAAAPEGFRADILSFQRGNGMRAKEKPLGERIRVTGIPKYIPAEIAEDCRARIAQAVDDLLYRSGMKSIALNVGTGNGDAPETASGSTARGGPSSDEMTIEERARQYRSRPPLFDFDFLVVPADVRESLLSAVELVLLEETVFDRWNLRSIEPFPRAALNFHGHPGTGKTLAAHAVAAYLNKPILMASYAQVESKYVGDGSKNVEAVFFAAERDGAILFVDEADSLLSRRLTDVTQGAEQAINSMRSQLLICLENYRGVVIFSTNLVENYDRAFDTRMRHIQFPMPDRESRRLIWDRHLPKELPLAGDVSSDLLADLDNICGRDIKNAVIDAALRAARSRRNRVGQSDLVQAVERIKAARIRG